MTSTDAYTALSLSKMRNGDKRGTFTIDGHEVTVVAQTRDSGKYTYVRACSDTHPALSRVLRDVGLLIKRGVGRYSLVQPGEHTGYEDRGTIASLAERLTRYALTPAAADSDAPAPKVEEPVYQTLRGMKGRGTKVAVLDLVVGHVVRVDGVRYRVQEKPTTLDTGSVVVEGYSEDNQPEPLFLSSSARVTVLGTIQ